MKRKILLFALATIAMVVVMQITSANFTTKQTPAGIFNFELASNKAAADAIINHWTDLGAIGDAVNNTYWDFLFVICYCGLLIVLCHWAEQRMAKIGLQKTAGFLAKAMVLAALADYIENILMLRSLQHPTSDGIVKTTFVLVCIKFFIIICTILFLLYSLFAKKK